MASRDAAAHFVRAQNVHGSTAGVTALAPTAKMNTTPAMVAPVAGSWLTARMEGPTRELI